MDKFNLNIFTLKLAIGTIWLVSIFLFICGIYNIFPFIERLTGTSTWGIIVTIPTLVFSYTIGEVATYLSNSTFFNKTSSLEEIDDFVSIVNTENGFFVKRYENMQHQFQFFKTCIPTLIFLGFSVIWSSFWVFRSSSSIDIRNISIGLGILTILSSIVMTRMTNKKKKEIKYLIERHNIKNS